MSSSTVDKVIHCKGKFIYNIIFIYYILAILFTMCYFFVLYLKKIKNCLTWSIGHY